MNWSTVGSVSEVECNPFKSVCTINSSAIGEINVNHVTTAKGFGLPVTTLDSSGKVKFKKGLNKGMVCRYSNPPSEFTPAKHVHRTLECKQTDIGEDVTW